MKKIKVTIEMLDELLGTCSSDPKIHEDFIASKAPDAASREEEVEALGVEAVVEKGKTIFPKEDGKPFVYSYQIRGFIFVEPRKIMIEMPEGTEIGDCQRPLRVSTAQGERVALANSESIPAGSRLTFEVETETDQYLDAVLEWLAYGRHNGLGQWRNSGKGAFRVVDIHELKCRPNEEVNRLKKMLAKE